MKLKALITYDGYTGKTLKREEVDVMFSRGEPHPRDRVICVELPAEGKKGRCVYLGLKTLARATGLKISEGRRRRS